MIYGLHTAHSCSHYQLCRELFQTYNILLYITEIKITKSYKQLNTLLLGVLRFSLPEAMLRFSLPEAMNSQTCLQYKGQWMGSCYMQVKIAARGPAKHIQGGGMPHTSKLVPHPCGCSASVRPSVFVLNCLIQTRGYTLLMLEKYDI